MVDTTLPQDQSKSRSTYVAERLTDPALIRSLLTPDRAYAAYALGQLTPHLFAISEWWVATGPVGQALVVHSRGGLGRALFVLGDPEGVGAVLSLHPGPRFAFASFRQEHLPAVQRYFHLVRPQLMLRMSVTRKTFRPVAGEAVRLRGRDVRRINRLYSREGGATWYSARNVEDGVYYGVMDNGRLVSIAGTHVVSPEEGVAVVGNVFTDPRRRGRGLATLATSAVTEALLKDCPLVVLTVEMSNTPAVRVYQSLGYRKECTLHETPIVRREPVGALSLARRLIAGWRGRREGKEVVVR